VGLLQQHLLMKKRRHLSLALSRNNDFQGETQSNTGRKNLLQCDLPNKISTCTSTEFKSPNFQLLGILIGNKDCVWNSSEGMVLS
jgi:hypothetical protein